MRRGYWVTLVLNGATTQGVFFLLAALAVLEAGDPLAVATQLLSQSVPALALLLLIRYSSSRFNFRSVFSRSLLLQGTASLAFAVCAWLFDYQLHTALILSFLLSLSSSLQPPGRRSVLADLYHDAEKRRATLAMITTYGNAARLAAPLLAGLLLAVGAWQWWFVLDAAACLVSALVARRALTYVQRLPSAPSRAPASGLPRLRSRTVVFFLAAYLSLCIFGLNIQVLAPLIARDLLEEGEAFVGLIVAAHSLGGLLGSFVVARASHALRTLYGIGMLLLGAGLLALLIPVGVGFEHALVVALAVLSGVGRGLSLTASSVMTSTWGSDSDFRERLIALTSLAFTASNVVSAGVIGLGMVMGGAFGALAICGVATMLAAAPALLMSRRWDPSSSHDEEPGAASAQHEASNIADEARGEDHK
ncbi:MAG: MFS transporter [Leucobacter sp.]|uniref:MFS transporter n=1 Tax=Agrococcus casei TaxID=343512 RepID=UPI003F924226